MYGRKSFPEKQRYERIVVQLYSREKVLARTRRDPAEFTVLCIAAGPSMQVPFLDMAIIVPAVFQTSRLCHLNESDRSRLFCP